MLTPHQMAASDFALKLKLEAPFQRSLKRLMNIIANDLFSMYIATEEVTDVNAYKIDLRGILKDNYRKVARAFKKNLRSRNKELSDQELGALIDSQLTTFINQQTEYQSDLIIATLDEELHQEIDDVIFDAAAEGVELSRDKIAADARRRFKDKIDGKVSGIATTETGIIAEKSKWVEATNLKKHKSMKMFKQWVSNLDEVTRVPHVFADGQRQEVDNPFTVGGERLMAPLDSSMGASAGNIIRCRCSAVYIQGTL